jgi:hypothetical protein
MLFMIFAPEQSYQLDYAACDYKEGVTGFSAKLLLSVRSWREKLRANPGVQECVRIAEKTRLVYIKRTRGGIEANCMHAGAYLRS